MSAHGSGPRRAPRRTGEWVADGLRLFAVMSVIAGAVWWSAMAAGILALTLPALVLPRWLRVRASFDIVFCAVVLAAAWSNVLDLYTAVSWWDLVMHFTCTGAVAAIVYLALARLAVVPDPGASDSRSRSPIVLVAAIGLAVSALWEMAEWVGATFVSEEIFVTYQDTIGDMAVGGLGALCAGLVVARVRLLRAD